MRIGSLLLRAHFVQFFDDWLEKPGIKTALSPVSTQNKNLSFNLDVWRLNDNQKVT